MLKAWFWIKEKKKANYKLATTVSPLPTTTPLPPYHPSPEKKKLTGFGVILDYLFMRRYNRQKLPSLLLLAFGRIIKNWANYYKMKLMSKLGRNFVPEVQQNQEHPDWLWKVSEILIKLKPKRQTSRIFSRLGSVKSSVPNFKIKIVKCEK